MTTHKLSDPPGNLDIEDGYARFVSYPGDEPDIAVSADSLAELIERFPALKENPTVKKLLAGA